MKKIFSVVCVCVWMFLLHADVYANNDVSQRNDESGRARLTDASGKVRLPDEQRIIDVNYFQERMRLAKMNPTWKTFLNDNPSWQALWNPLTGSPYRAWGKGIQIDGFTTLTEANAQAAGWKFVNDEAAVLGCRPDELRLLQAEEGNGKWYYNFKQQYKGLDVLNTFIRLRVSPEGKVFMFGSDFIRNISVNPNPTLGIEAAKEFAKVGLEYRPGTEYIDGGELYILPLKFESAIEARLVYQFTIEQSATERWYTCVDAHSGDVLWRYNLVMNASPDDPHSIDSPPKTQTIVKGKVTADIFKGSWLDTPTPLPMSNININVNGKELVTDMNGEFTIDVGTATNVPVIARMSGKFSRARRADTTLSVNNKPAFINTSFPTSADINIHWDNTNSVPAERNAFYHMNIVHNFIRGIDASSDLSNVDTPIQALVNISPMTSGQGGDTCNANWNGTRFNFFNESFLCANTATIADVVYHEYGHAVNQYYYIKRSGQPMTNGALGEGTSDILSNMLRDDPRIGIGFYKVSANSLLRNSDNKKTYPKDIMNEVHYDGEIIAGAVWDVRKNIGIDRARVISHFVKKGTPDDANTGLTYVSYFLEMLVADDNDNDLTNGTPNSDGIINGFSKHGIPILFTLTHTPLPDQDGLSRNDYPMDGTITKSVISATNITLDLTSVTVKWTLDNGKSWLENPLNINSPTTFGGVMPNQRVGSVVRYYLEGKNNYGGLYRLPDLPHPAAYIFLVGYVQKVFEKMEANPGWVIDPDQMDDAETGKWIRAIPIATTGGSQPGADHSPDPNDTQCWVTGNAPTGTSPGQNDVDAGATTLQTAAYDLSQYINPVLRYWKWYSNDLGATPGTDEWVVQISGDDGKTWVDLERTKQASNAWVQMVFVVKDYITPGTKVKVRFIASDFEPGSLIEACIDDFEFLDINTSINSAEDILSPNAFALAQNYPNPFSSLGGSTSISFSIPHESFVTLKVFNHLGAEVRSLAHEVRDSGIHTVAFDARDLPSGTYMYELRADGQRLLKKMVCIK